MADALREVFAEFGIEFDDAQLRDGARSVGGVIARVRELGSVLAGNQIVQAIRAFASEFEAQSGALEDTAAALGVTTDELQGLRFAAGAAGVSAEQADAAFAKLRQNASAAATGGAAQAAAFRALGVNVRDAGGQVRGLADLSADVAAGLGRIEDPARRAQLATQLLGERGARLASVLHEGEGGLAALRAELGELGGGVLPEAIEAAGAYGDATDRNKVATDALRSVLATALLPALTFFVQKATEVEVWLVRVTRGTHAAEIAVGALGVASTVMAGRMLLAWLPVLRPFLLLAAGIALVVAAGDDLATMIEGGDSALGRFLDHVGGLGTQQRMVVELTQAWEGFKLFLGELGDDVRFLRGAFGEWLTGARAGAASLATTFTDAWASIRARFDSTFGPILARVDALVAGARRLLGVADGTGGGGGGTARPAAPRAEGFFEGVMAEWRDVFSGRNASMAPTVAPRGARSVTSNRTVNVAAINVTGAESPEATARAVRERLRAAERAGADAAYPVREED